MTTSDQKEIDWEWYPPGDTHNWFLLWREWREGKISYVTWNKSQHDSHQQKYSSCLYLLVRRRRRVQYLPVQARELTKLLLLWRHHPPLGFNQLSTRGRQLLFVLMLHTPDDNSSNHHVDTIMAGVQFLIQLPFLGFLSFCAVVQVCCHRGVT